MSIGLTITIILFLFLLMFGVPLAFSIGFSSLVYFLVSGNFSLITVLPERFMTGMDSFTLMAIPLFIFMGELMSKGGITDDLTGLCNFFFGRFRGALAYTNVLVSTLFAGISGSALADVGALGSTLVPAMVKSGYDLEFSAAVTVASSVQSPLIPPSVPAVLVAGVTGLSVGAIFLAGAVPGLLTCLMCCVVVFILARKRNYPVHEVNWTLKGFVEVLGNSVLALFAVVIILGGVLFGIFTVTESAAIGAAYALVLTFVVMKMDRRIIVDILKGTLRTTAVCYILLGMVNMFSWIMANEQVPQKLAVLLASVSDNPYVLLMILNAFLIVWGMFMDVGAAIVIFSPLIYPVFSSFGVHPIHLSAILVFNLMIGLTTPPFGTLLYLCAGVTGVDFAKLVKEMVPFYIGELAILLMITYIPEVTLFLPRLAGLLN